MTQSPAPAPAPVVTPDQPELDHSINIVGAHQLNPEGVIHQDNTGRAGAEPAPPQDGDPQGEPQPDPAWWSDVPEKFRADTLEESVKRMSGSYTELETKYGQSQTRLQELERPRLEAPEVESAQAAFGKAVGDVLDRNKVDWQGMRERYFTYEELTQSDHRRLEEAGISPAMFEDALMGERTRVVLAAEEKRKAEQEAAGPQKKGLNNEESEAIVKEFAGGNMDAFNRMSYWGKENLSADQMEGIQRAINTGDLQVARAAISGLAVAYKASQGQERPLQLVGGQSPASSTGPVDATEAQKILRDPRWRQLDAPSRAWRAQQEAREWIG